MNLHLVDDLKVALSITIQPRCAVVQRVAIVSRSFFDMTHDVHTGTIA